jgi:hypothetical protein
MFNSLADNLESGEGGVAETPLQAEIPKSVGMNSEAAWLADEL